MWVDVLPVLPGIVIMGFYFRSLHREYELEQFIKKIQSILREGLRGDY
jgi:hypothetical protein